MFRKESVPVASLQHHRIKGKEDSQPSALHELQAFIKTEKSSIVKNEHDAVSVKLESNLGIKSETSEGSDEKFTLDMKIVENRGEPEKSPLNTFRDKLLMI